MTVVFDIILQK